MKEKEFEVCVRAIIRRGNKILVCEHKEKNYYFFPGGHIEFGEAVKEALVRELKEELNILIRKISFIGVIENIFKEDSQKHHEINLVFNVRADKVSDKSLEDHINFVLMDEKRFSRETIFPIALKKSIIRWLKNKKNFWGSQVYNKTQLQ